MSASGKGATSSASDVDMLAKCDVYLTETFPSISLPSASQVLPKRIPSAGGEG